MFIRFVIENLDPDSGSRQGLFQAVSELSDNGELSESEEIYYNEVRQWFSKNLEAPKRLSKATRRHAKSVAISWFKPTAIDHIEKMLHFAAILKAHGFQVSTLKTERPGFVVYEDDFQVTAEPFKDTKA